MMPHQNESHLIWTDLEMTGLDPFRDSIIEIATIVTNRELEVLAVGPVIAIHRPAGELDGMDDWNKSHHGSSGLIERVRNSQYTDSMAESETLAFLQQWVPAGKSPMCGNSICQDRRFMARSMPLLEVFFHYRNLDVSTLKELANRWSPTMAAGFFKDSKHLALDDIRDSIDELRYYREHFLRLEKNA